MNAITEITQAEQAGWQQRAARELVALLASHRELPIIGWMLASAGSGLVGQISGPAPSRQRRDVFDAWQTALQLGAAREVVSGNGTVLLSASAQRNRVRVTLRATLPAEDDAEEVTA